MSAAPGAAASALRRGALSLLLPALLIALPIALRVPAPAAPAGAARLVILTPNNETIRGEFARGFSAWAQRELGRQVEIDWRTPGGTNDIVKAIEAQFSARFANDHADLPAAARAAFNDPKAGTDPQRDEAERAARRAFLASDAGIGVDLFWGGGEYDFRQCANKGYLVDAGLAKALPEVLREEVIPQTLAGETIYDPQGRYYGTALSSFGLCANPDRLALLADPTPPNSWEDLGAARFLGAGAMADPTRSGSVNTCFVMMVQQQMAKAAGADGQKDPARLDTGWAAGFTVIKRIGANARYVTDSAARVVRDVGRGDAAVGMCIDFYGRAEREWTREESGRDRLIYAGAVGGTSLSADPIGLLRGAPQGELARAFMRYVLTAEAQRLWLYRVGEPGGPVRYALHRLSVRRDLYTPEHTAHFADPGEDPFALAQGFSLHSEWTGPNFELIRLTIKALVLDPRPELVAAWRAIVAAGGPERCPEAMAELAWMPYAFRDAAAARAMLVGDRIATLRRWSVEAIAHYAAAQRLAGQGPATTAAGTAPR